MKMMIEDWAMSQAWEELSAEQQNEVLAHMSRAEYQNLHRHLQDIQGLDAEIVPPPHLRTRLLQHLGTASFLEKKGMQVNIPLWQTAAAVLLAIVATHYFTPKLVLAPPSEVVYVRDTLVQEKVVWRERIIKKQEIVYRYRDTLEQHLVEENKGISLEDTPELLGLFTQAEK